MEDLVLDVEEASVNAVSYELHPVNEGAATA